MQRHRAHRDRDENLRTSEEEKHMNRNVTAVYRTHAVADLVRRELEALGISSGHIHLIPGREDEVGSGGYREESRYIDALHDLHLPDDDLRTYQQSVRRGDYVVSANVDDNLVSRVQEVMRRPEAEAYNLDTRHSEFSTEELIPHSDIGRRGRNADWLGQRDPAYSDPYVRSYRRNAPIGGRTS